jgi:hypothetical protein
VERDEFRRLVLERDGGRCVLCRRPAQDAHHIMERRLFEYGGYVLDNGVSLCGDCHVRAEQTLVTPEKLREKAGIKDVVLPEHLYDDLAYDKWGNIVNPDGSRVRGELFDDVSVQKVLPDEVKRLFSKYVKYPRTYHVPWTESQTTDDRVHEKLSFFYGEEVVVSEKRDGENFSIYSDGYFHARSTSGNSHPSQGWLKNFSRSWCYDLPEGWRVCGENLYATHSLKYDDLASYFEVFSVWDEHNECLSWDETLEWCGMLGLTAVPVLYRGVYDEAIIKGLKLDTERQEGYVIRLAERFTYAQFRRAVAKFVRKDHVQETVHNWRRCWDAKKVNAVKRAKVEVKSADEIITRSGNVNILKGRKISINTFSKK